MRGILETVAVAFSMFSALPMPQISWEKRNMRYALCAFPPVSYTHLTLPTNSLV